MNGVAWVVEVQTRPNGPWSLWYVRETRKELRMIARNIRTSGYRARVRKYLRQPEVRP